MLQKITDVRSSQGVKLDKMKNYLKKQSSLEKKDLEFVSGSGHANLYGSAIFIWENNKYLGIGIKNFYNI